MVRVKSLSMIEEALPEMYERMHDPREPLSSKVELFKTIGRFGGIGAGSIDGVGGDNKQLRLSILGPDLKQLARLANEATAKIKAIPGVEAYAGQRAVRFQGGVQPKQILIRVARKLGDFDSHPMIEHFRFLKSRTKQTPKMTIPSPSAVHFRDGRAAVPTSIYPDMDEFYRDLGQTYRKAVRAFADAGCRYLQLDEVFIAMLCDAKYRKQMVDRGDDPEKLGPLYGNLINAAMSDIPSDMTITMHLCRGNYKSTFQGSGGYEAEADVLFNQINVHGYFMEYDTERAGGFEPLRLLPKGKQVVLGLVTTKSGKLESKDELKRRIEQAAKFCDIDQLCLSGQCGFASTEEGNVLTEDEQWAKLRLAVEVAQEIWGK